MQYICLPHLQNLSQICRYLFSDYIPFLGKKSRTFCYLSVSTNSWYLLDGVFMSDLYILQMKISLSQTCWQLWSSKSYSTAWGSLYSFIHVPVLHLFLECKHQHRKASILHQSLSGAKTRYLELSSSGEGYVIPLSNTYQLQTLHSVKGLHRSKVASVDFMNVHYLQHLSNPMDTHL